MTLQRPRRRARLLAATTTLVATVTVMMGAPAASAAPDDPATAPPAIAAPGKGSPLADPGVRQAYDAWASGGYAPPPGVAADRLRVEVLHSAAAEPPAVLAASGATAIALVAPTLSIADVPFTALRAVQDADGVEYLRLPVAIAGPPIEPVLPQQPSPIQTGSRGSDVLTKTNAPSWHSSGFTGTGVRVGIIDYFTASIWTAAQNSGELTGYYGSFCRSNGIACDVWASPSASGGHGVAVAETISDMAPGAMIYVATATTTADTRAAVDYFASQGVTVISRSLATFLDGPGDGTGAADAVLDYAVSKGIMWLNSAGNAAPRSSGGTGGYWRGTWSDTNADSWLDFHVSGSSTTSSYLKAACGYFQGLRWSDWGADRSDYDLYAFAAPGGAIIAQSVADQAAGAPPIEGASLNSIDCSTYPTYYIAVSLYAPAPGSTPVGDILELMTNASFQQFVTSAGSAGAPFSDTANPGALSVGAVDPVAGTTAADYSSRGPTNDGRIKPDISAGSNFTSYSLGMFNGTSAATPVVAGAAALVKQRFPSYTPAQIVSYLKFNAVVDRGATGNDNTYGRGELRLPTLSATLNPTPTPTISGTAAVGSTLVASPGTWGPAPVTRSYQWKRNGVAISGATATTYKLVTADAGTAITISVTGSKSGYTSVTKTSAAKAIPLLTLSPTPTPTISGTAAVGSTLVASPGTWGPAPVTRTYQWKRNGAAISGATATTYKLVTADKGKTITITVTGSKPNYATVSKTSSGKAIP